MRFGELIGGPAPITITGMKRYVRNNAERAEDRWIRADILCATGDLDAARDMAARIPDDTPYGRVERTAAMAYVDWLSGGPGNTAGVREAADAIQPVDSDERLRAEVAVAAAEVRDLVAAGDRDPTAPLLAIRDRLGRRADAVLRLAARRVVRTVPPDGRRLRHDLHPSLPHDDAVTGRPAVVQGRPGSRGSQPKPSCWNRQRSSSPIRLRRWLISPA